MKHPGSRTRPLKLSRLRDIAFSLWDPIGLIARGESWENKPFADEYDDYLVPLAGRLRRGSDAKDEVRFLIRMEVEHMGLAHSTTTVARAEATVAAIGEYLSEIG